MRACCVLQTAYSIVYINNIYIACCPLAAARRVSCMSSCEEVASIAAKKKKNIYPVCMLLVRCEDACDL